jgi:hypothetical protein
MRSATTHLTAMTLAALSGLHVAWGRGSAFPWSDRGELAEAVVGTSSVPGTLPCFGVAAALAVATSAVENWPRWPDRLHRLALAGLAAVLGGRGLLGLAGKTNVVSPGSDGARFRRLDRRVYAPLCLGLAAGVAGQALPARRSRGSPLPLTSPDARQRSLLSCSAAPR